jgi:cytochrome o ubiquinol oxidase subunit I
LIVAEVGAVVILCGILAAIAQLVVSIRTREHHRDLTGDPWDGRTLEWSIASPPPRYNFAVMPQVESRDAFASMKEKNPAGKAPSEQFESIELPGNSPNGFVTAFFAVITGFALIWHIWWMAILGIACALTTLLAFGWLERVNIEVSVEELARDARARMSKADPA